MMKKKPKPTLDIAQYRVLLHFAREHGRNWKQALRDTWMKACEDQPFSVPGLPTVNYPGVLQRLRNHPDFGPSWLTTFKFKVR